MNRDTIETWIRLAANRLGIDIHRHRPESAPAGRLSAMLGTHGIDLVMDVGANTGQFARSLRGAGYRGRLVSFEPLAAAHALLSHASRHDPLWEVAPRVALGDAEGDIEIHVAGNSVSSSALAMLDRHITASPGSAFVGHERVRLARLDTMASHYLLDATVPFVKIDTQGYEDRVLDGAPEVLSRVRGVQLELSFVALYDGQKLFDALTQRLCLAGFSIWAIWPGICDPRTGRMLQVDAVYFRD